MMLAKNVCENGFQMILQGYNLHVGIVPRNLVKMSKTTKQVEKGD